MPDTRAGVHEAGPEILNALEDVLEKIQTEAITELSEVCKPFLQKWSVQIGSHSMAIYLGAILSSIQDPTLRLDIVDSMCKMIRELAFDKKFDEARQRRAESAANG